MSLSVYNYHSLNGAIEPPINVLEAARAADLWAAGRTVSVGPYCDGDGEYTIPPLYGWRVIIRCPRAGIIRYWYFAPDGAPREQREYPV